MFRNISLFGDDLCVVHDEQEFEGNNLMMCPEQCRSRSFHDTGPSAYL